MFPGNDFWKLLIPLRDRPCLELLIASKSFQGSWTEPLFANRALGAKNCESQVWGDSREAPQTLETLSAHTP